MLKKILLAALWLPLMALAQTYPSPTYNNVTVQGTLTGKVNSTGSTITNATITGGTISGLSSPLPVASGGTGVTTSTGSGNVVLGTSPTIASPTITGALTATGLVTTADLATQAANTVLSNVTGSSASPTAFAMPSCSSSTSALQWTSGTGFTCYGNSASLTGATFTGSVSISPASGPSVFTMNRVAAQNGLINLQTSGSERWAFGAGSGAESGGNVGSDFIFQRFSDAGSLLDSPVTIARNTGVVTFADGISLPSQTANTVLAAPSGSAGVPGFRALNATDLGNAIWITPQTYGALGNSNGTTGNGHDDTAAINSAIAAAAAQTNSRSLTGGTVYFPCGIYRITSTMAWTSTTSSVHLLGAGACSQIYNDASTAQTTMTFSGGSCPNSVAPCVSVEGLNFITPTNVSSSAYAMTFTGVSAPTLKGNIINGYGRGISLTTSYGPALINNTFSNLQGAALICTADDSCNNAIIVANRVSFVGSTLSEASFKFGPGVTTGCIGNPDNILFQGNDLEQSYGGPQFLGSCSVSIKDNYIAQNTAFAFNWGTPGYNRTARIEGNYIAENGGTINGPGPWTQSIANVAGVDFGTNSWFHQNLTWSGLTAVNWSSFQAVGTGSSLQNYCNETMNCSYMTNGWIREWGTATTASGSVAVTFPLACPTAGPKEFMVTDANGSNLTAWISTSSQTGMTLNSSVAAAFLSWAITCN